MDKEEVKNVGLILSGGGAKGAYEIGVFKALEDLGLADTVTGVAGTSVGALNSILFVNRDIKKAVQIWGEVEQS